VAQAGYFHQGCQKKPAAGENPSLLGYLLQTSSENFIGYSLGHDSNTDQQDSCQEKFPDF